MTYSCSLLDVSPPPPIALCYIAVLRPQFQEGLLQIYNLQLCQIAPLTLIFNGSFQRIFPLSSHQLCGGKRRGGCTNAICQHFARYNFNITYYSIYNKLFFKFKLNNYFNKNLRKKTIDIKVIITIIIHLFVSL